jgi:hypothetical protein
VSSARHVVCMCALHVRSMPCQVWEDVLACRQRCCASTTERGSCQTSGALCRHACYRWQL